MALKSDTVILITGASSGFGRATAEHLAGLGAKVYGTSRRAPEFPAGELVEGSFGTYKLGNLDVCDVESVNPCVAAVLEDAGRIDALVNNAGYALGASIEEASEAEVDEQFQTNYFGALRMIRAVLPSMRERRSGRIVTIGSLAGLIGVPFHGHYSAAKFALEGMSEALRQEIYPYGIHVSLVEPGDFKTEGTKNRRLPIPGIEDYRANRERAIASMEKTEQSGPDPIHLARLIARILSADKPRLRYRIGTDAYWVPKLRRLIPESLFEFLLRKIYDIR